MISMHAEPGSPEQKDAKKTRRVLEELAEIIESENDILTPQLCPAAFAKLPKVSSLRCTRLIEPALY